MDRDPFDVLIVGSGAGGGIAAYVLAKAGARVCVLEKGPWLHGKNYGDDELRFGDRRFFDQDPLIEPRTFRNRPDDGDHLYVGKVLGISRCVGGGTVHGGAGCSYCGFCSNHGCPIGAKGDLAVTAIAQAVKTGRLEVRANSHAFHVDVKKGQARRVHYIDPKGRTRSVSAKVIVLACSALETPRLVLLSELPTNLVNHDLVGRYLMAHQYVGGIGFFSNRIDYYRGFWSMRCIDDYYFGDPHSGERMFGMGNIQTVGPSSGYPLGAGGMISTAKFAGWGAGHKERMNAMFGHVQWLAVNGEDPPVRSNMVDLDPTVQDAYGLPVSRVTYSH